MMNFHKVCNQKYSFLSLNCYRFLLGKVFQLMMRMGSNNLGDIHNHPLFSDRQGTLCWCVFNIQIQLHTGCITRTQNIVLECS